MGLFAPRLGVAGQPRPKLAPSISHPAADRLKSIDLGHFCSLALARSSLSGAFTTIIGRFL